MSNKKKVSSREDYKAFAYDIAIQVLVKNISKEKVADDLGISKAKVYRALNYAFKHGLVTYTLKKEGRDKPKRNADLEQELRYNYNLFKVVVIEDMQLDQSNSYHPQADDELHYYLGREVAIYLKENIRPGDSLLTVGGRGTFFPAKCLLEELSSNFNIPNVKVFSLSGRMATRVHEAMGYYATPSADADDAAFMFGKAFKSHPKLLFRLVAEEDQYDHWDADFSELFDKKGDPVNSALCVCGVGRLGGKHTFMSDHSMLGAIRADLRELKDLLSSYEQRIGDYVFYPVGDMANRLFLTEHLNDKKLQQDVEIKMDKINRKIVGLTFSHFAKIPTIILNAGGFHKYPSLRKVLSFERAKNEPLINALFTDEKNARLLLEEKDFPKINVAELPGETNFGHNR